MENRSSLCIHQIFEQQVAKTPDRIALVMQGREVTYATVNQQANQIANALRALGVGAETPVGICLRRSPEAIIALLGILKAGGAYLPIDPDFPEARKRYMLEDAACAVLITDAALCHTLPSFSGKILRIDDERLSQQADENLNLPLSPQTLLYILYTSGSTGTPKGVCGIHSATLNRCIWMWQRYPFAEGEVCSHKTTLNFVDSVWEIFGPLLQGIKLVILPQSANSDPQAMIHLLGSARVTRIVLVPSLLQMLLKEQAALGKALPNLKLWSVSGEPLTPSLLQRFRAGVPDGILLNLYGSTEVAGDVTWAEFAGRSKEIESGIPIGRPILQAELYILNEQMQPVALGEVGELWVGGPVLARGYHNKPQETQARFVANHFSGKGMLFKTGDRVWADQDGLIYYMGRIDNQVKLRGFRIELEEIEKILVQFQPEPTNVVLVLHKDETNEVAQLVAFVTPACTDVQKLHQYALSQLPSYMIPARIVALETLPLTPTGKVDRQALSVLGRCNSRAGEMKHLPERESERLLAAIWQEMLHVLPIEPEDNFFALGGDSLSVVAFLAKLKQEYGVKIPLSDFLNQPTLAAVATCYEQYQPNNGQPQHEINRNDVEIVLFEERYLAQTIEVVSESFIHKGPLEVELGIKKEEFVPFVAQICQKVLRSRLSYLALDKVSGNVLGFCLCEDLADYISYQFDVSASLNPVIALLDAIEQPYVKQHSSISPGEVFHIFISGSDPQIEGSALVLALESKALDMAAALKYQRAVTTCTHSVTNYIAQELGFQRIQAISFGMFEYEGRNIFAPISDLHQEAVLLEKVLTPFKMYTT